MPRNRRLSDYLRRRENFDMRNPYGSAGGYVVSSRRGRGRDRLMMDDMARYNRGESDMDLADMTRQHQGIMHDPYMPRDYETGEVYDGVDDFYGREEDMARGRRNYDMARGRRNMDYNYDYARRRMDGHYPISAGSTYYPIEAMGVFNGYYGMGGQDYARGRYRRDYTYDYVGGDFGENLGKEEISHWTNKLMKEVEDKDKQFFSKENIMRKAQEMGIKFDKFNQEEFYVTALMMYTDYCKTLGTANMDIYLRLAKDWLEDDDVSVKGGEKLAVYHDCIVEGEDD